MRKGLTVIEVVVAIVAIAVIVGVVVPMMGRPLRRGSPILKESLNLRNIHMGLAIYGSSNKDYFPGLSATGDYLGKPFEGEYYGARPNANDAAQEKSGEGCTLSAGTNLALAMLLDDCSATPAQMISPGETGLVGSAVPKPITEVVPDAVAKTHVVLAAPGMPAAVGEVRDEHFSFAMLAYGKPNLKEEWKTNQNQQACVLGSRLMFDAKGFSSVWTDTDSGKWKGSVVRGDTSTMTETFKSGDLATPSNPFATLKYGAAVFTPTTESTTTVGIFGRSTDMKNFDATAAAGQIGSAND